MISDYDREHVDAIIAGHGDWFTAYLLRLMHKADATNYAKLAMAFPQEAAAYSAWLNDDGDREEELDPPPPQPIPPDYWETAE